MSYQTNLLRIREAMLDTPSARSKFLDLLDVGRTEMRKAQMFAGLIEGRRRRTPRPAASHLRPAPRPAAAAGL